MKYLTNKLANFSLICTQKFYADQIPRMSIVLIYFYLFVQIGFIKEKPYRRTK